MLSVQQFSLRKLLTAQQKVQTLFRPHVHHYTQIALSGGRFGHSFGTHVCLWTSPVLSLLSAGTVHSQSISTSDVCAKHNSTSMSHAYEPNEPCVSPSKFREGCPQQWLQQWSHCWQQLLLAHCRYPICREGVFHGACKRDCSRRPSDRPFTVRAPRSRQAPRAGGGAAAARARMCCPRGRMHTATTQRAHPCPPSLCTARSSSTCPHHMCARKIAPATAGGMRAGKTAHRPAVRGRTVCH